MGNPREDWPNGRYIKSISWGVCGIMKSGCWRKRVKEAGRSFECKDRLYWSRVDMSMCMYFEKVHAYVIMNILFVVEPLGSLDHDNHAG